MSNMNEEKVTVDEFGIISFSIFDVETKKLYRFDKLVQKDHIFVTTFNSHGKVIAKKVIDTSKKVNKQELESFNNYVLENYTD